MMKHKIFLSLAVLVIAITSFSQPAPLPGAEQLKNSIRQLIQSSRQRFKDIDAGMMDASSPDYHRSSFHIVPNTRNQLFLSTDSAKDEFTEYIREGITAAQVDIEFNELIQMFNQVVLEFNFLNKIDGTYGAAYYFYNLPVTLMCQIEAYLNPTKNNSWNISLTLRHPTKGDLEFIEKKLHPGQ